MDHKKLYEIWCENATEDQDLVQELAAVKNDDEAIFDRFYTSLKFGTAGLRGVIGAGTNRMNIYVVRQATQGLANYVLNKYGKGAVAISHDSRIKADLFMIEAAKVLAANGLKVYITSELQPTPVLSYLVRYFKCQAGIMVTASHNPQEYNGMKLVRKESRPISADTGLMDIRDKVLSGELPEKAAELGKVYDVNCMPEYVEHLLTYIDTSALKPLKIVVNAGNGAAGPVIDAIQDKLPFEFIKVNHEPDGTFPNGVPNPLLEENRDATASVVLREKADLGVAWDGDFDRCFLFDENGVLVEGYYMVGLLAQAFLAQNKGAKIIYDPRLIWNTIELVEAAGGTPVMCKSGHAFIKERMRNVEAVYGGEMSAHH